jgi:hypothetical protein
VALLVIATTQLIGGLTIARQPASDPAPTHLNNRR